MPQIPPIKYSRKATITAIRDYYSFLSTMYLNPTSTLIRDPPPGGWPLIHSATISSLLNKDEEVGLLLRSLPILIHSSPIMPHCAPQTFFTDWTTNLFHLSLGLTTVAFLKARTEASCPHVPEHCVGLTDGSAGGYGATMILNTKFGVVHWLHCPEHIRNDVVRPQVRFQHHEHLCPHLHGAPAAVAATTKEDLQVQVQHHDNDIYHDIFGYDDPPTASASASASTQQPLPSSSSSSFSPCPASYLFTNSGTWTIPDFFDMLKDLFRSLRFFPVNSYNVYDIADTREEEQDKVQKILDAYRAHGWPWDLEKWKEERELCVELVGWLVDEWCRERMERMGGTGVGVGVEMERGQEVEMETVGERQEEGQERSAKRVKVKEKKKDREKQRAGEERPTNQTGFAFPETDMKSEWDRELESMGRGMWQEGGTEQMETEMEIEMVGERQKEQKERSAKRVKVLEKVTVKKKDKGKGRTIEERPTSQTGFAFPETDMKSEWDRELKSMGRGMWQEGGMEQREMEVEKRKGEMEVKNRKGETEMVGERQEEGQERSAKRMKLLDKGTVKKKKKDKGKGRAIEERPTSQTVYEFPETETDMETGFGSILGF